MNPPDFTYKLPPDREPLALNEAGIEDLFIQKLRDLKYTDRPDIHDRASLEKNFREKFEALNRVRLTDAASASPMPSSPACSKRSSPPTSSPPPRSSARSTPSPATTARR